jgi:hypothetical protein
MPVERERQALDKMRTEYAAFPWLAQSIEEYQSR